MKSLGFPRRPSAALVVSLVALVVAVTGTATAAQLLITSREIENGTIRLVDLSPKTVKALQAKSVRAQLATRALYAQDSITTDVVRDASNASQTLQAASQPVPGDLLALGQNGRFPVSALPNVAARVYSSKDEEIPLQIAGGPVKLLTFDRVSFDTAGLWDPAHPTRLTAPVSGVYVITTNVSWQLEPVAGMNRDLTLWVNGHVISVDDRSPTPGPRQTVTAIYKLAAGDDVEVGMGQDAFASTKAEAVGDYAPSLAMALVAQG